MLDATATTKGHTSPNTEDFRIPFEQLIEAIPDAMIVAKRDGGIVWASAQAAKLFGYDREEFTEISVEMLVPPRSREAFASFAREFSPNHHGQLTEGGSELFATRKDGAEIPVEISLSPLRTEDGRLVLCLVRDVADRRRQEQEIRNRNQGLTDRNAALAATNKELEGFVYSVAYDLRKPLRAIDGFSQAILDECGSQLDDQGKGYLKRLRSASQRMAQLIDHILTLSRLTRLDLKRQTVNLSRIAHRVAESLRQTSPRRKAEFVIEPEVVAHVDRVLSEAVVENLLGNAWKFTRKRAQARIEFGVRSENGGRVFFVRDNGAGFNMDLLPRLFGAFQRLHRQEEFEGTGMGLATVHRIVARHGGRSWAEGKVGHGATFYFTMP